MLAACLTAYLLVGNGLNQQPASEFQFTPPPRELPAKVPEPKPITVADVVKSLGLDEEKVTYIGEASGQPRMLSWSKVKLPGTTTEVDVEIQIGEPLPLKHKGKVVHEITVGDARNKTWNIKCLRDVTVLKVTISPPRKID